MYRKQLLQNFLGTLSILLLITLVTACSGVIGPRSGVLIEIPAIANNVSGRYIDTSGNTMTKGYVIIAQEDKVYSFNDYADSYDLKNGRVFISNIPVGKYILGVVLLNDEDNTNGLAIKEITVEPGLNEVRITVGPGTSNLKIGDMEVTNPLLPNDNYSISYKQDTLIFDYNRKELERVHYIPSFGESDEAPKLSINKVELINPAGDNEVLKEVSIDDPIFVGKIFDGLEYTIANENSQEYSLTIILR